ncbi:MAG: alpha-glucosidase [Lachnospiraceae bacterium]|jgi:oligo-1,6-glucosidase|nr:alpha-glucosidase [Lachnospiraceae bacterium]
MKQHWWQRSVVYQIYPRSFQDTTGNGIGDIAGITRRLDYLKELGIDVIWLSPVYQSPGVDNGYDISDYQSILPEFGTMDDFDRMLTEAHRRGIRIVMDLVVNHTSDQHGWFLESREGKGSAKRDWYIWSDACKGGAPNQLKSVFSGSAWEYDATSEQYYLHLFAKEQPDLNWENEELRRSIYRMMRWWLDKGIDGFRMDVISMISKPLPALLNDGGPGGAVTNGPMVHEYLREMNHEVLSHYDAMTVGETADVTIEEAKKYANEDQSELSMVFEFEHVEIGSGMCGKWTTERFRLGDLRAVLSKWQTGLEGFAWNSLYWSNHDQPRAVSRFGCDRPEYRELSAKMLATCLHMLKGTPYIYQGEELGMTNAYFYSLEEYRDIESLNAYKEYTENGMMDKDMMLSCLGMRSRDNARTPMQWDATPSAGFTNGSAWIPLNPNYACINAEAQRQDPDSVFCYYKQLIALRREYDIIVYGTYSILPGNTDQIWCYARDWKKERLVVLCNFSAEHQTCKWMADLENHGAYVMISNYKTHKKGELQAYETIVLHYEQWK